ncbi:MAG: host-nuclease inhibitor Gam family protein, partial [Clostridia bacterium]|nr:host-nuclease inhibitor Gam family protein [Clostridia bacterium]
EKYRLLSGTLTLKYGGIDAKRDDTALVPFLRETGHEELVKVKEEVAWGELKKLLTFAGDTAIMTDTGEVVPGLTITTKPDTFNVDV